MKKLFEIATDGYGESYVRSYCWAECEEDAREIFLKIMAERSKNQPHSIVEVTELFSEDADEFITVPSDSGFETEGIVTIKDLTKVNRIKIP